jgi:hypothetical protein
MEILIAYEGNKKFRYYLAWQGSVIHMIGRLNNDE